MWWSNDLQRGISKRRTALRSSGMWWANVPQGGMRYTHRLEKGTSSGNPCIPERLPFLEKAIIDRSPRKRWDEPPSVPTMIGRMENEMHTKGQRLLFGHHTYPPFNRANQSRRFETGDTVALDRQTAFCARYSRSTSRCLSRSSSSRLPQWVSINTTIQSFPYRH
jgi:hypothetical protein